MLAEMRPHPAGRSSTLLNNYLVVLAGTLLQNLALFGLSVLMASLYGASFQVDAFRSALTPPLMLSAVLVGTGGPVLMLLLLGKYDQPQAPLTATVVFLLLVGLAVCAATVGVANGAWLMHWLHPWFDADRQTVSTQLFQILAWMLPINTVIGLSQVVLNSQLNFLVPAISGTVGPVLTILFVWQWGHSGDILPVGWATFWGGIASIGCQLPWLLRGLTWQGPWRSVSLSPQGMIAWPLLLGMAALKIDPLVDQFLASQLVAGRIAQWDYASRLITPFLMLSSGLLSTVAFPRLSRAAGMGETEEFRREAITVWRGLVTLCLPACVVLLVFAGPLVQDVYQRNEFRAGDALIVSQLAQILSLMLAGAAVAEIASKILYADGDTLTPNLIVALSVLVGFACKAWLVQTWGIYGIACTTAGVFVGIALIQSLLASRRLGGSLAASLISQVWKCSLATALAVGIGWLVLRVSMPFPALWGLVAGGIVYFLTVFVLDAAARDWIRQRWRNAARSF